MKNGFQNLTNIKSFQSNYINTISYSVKNEEQKVSNSSSKVLVEFFSKQWDVIIKNSTLTSQFRNFYEMMFIYPWPRICHFLFCLYGKAVKT